MLKKVMLCSIIILSFVFNSHFSSASGPTKEDPITLTYSTGFPEKCFLGDLDKWWMSEITKRTNGKIVFKKYYSGSLASYMESLPATSRGVIHISHLPESYFSEQLPLGTLTNSVSLVRDPKKVHDAAYKLRFESGEVSDFYKKEAEKQNLIFLQVPPMHYTLFSKKKITSLKDVENIKIRSTGVYYPKIFQQIKVVSVDVLPAEWYDAMSRGTVDGLRLPHSYVSTYNIHEVAKNVSFDWGAITGEPLYMNLDSWKALPQDIKNVFEEMRKQYYEYSWNKYMPYIESQNAVLKENRVTVSDLESDLLNKFYASSLSVLKEEFLSRTKRLGLENEGKRTLEKYLEYLEIK